MNAAFELNNAFELDYSVLVRRKGPVEGVTRMRCEVGKPLKAVSVVAASVEGMKLPSPHPGGGEVGRGDLTYKRLAEAHTFFLTDVSIEERGVDGDTCCSLI